MNISKITIKNFRNIKEETSYSFNPHFTVIIGNNGKGKSTILHAMRIAAGSYLLGIPDAKPRHIWENEIRQEYVNNYLVGQTPVFIKAEGTIDEQPLHWQRQIPKDKKKTTSSYADVGEIRNIALAKAEEIKSGKNEGNVNNPVIAFFGTGRLYGGTRNSIREKYTGRRIFKYGYYNWYDLQYSSYQYTSWLRGHKFSVADKKESPVLYDSFIRAIKDANPYITALDFDGEELRIKVKLGDEEPESDFMPLSLHSDGIITHTGMVAELAFRCIMLNAHHEMESITKSRGIVMIDEIDLHLHPNWQRHVVDDLKKAFPMIQFVVTTHSPFIVQSLDSDELINLDRTTDTDIKDLKIDYVATSLMGVDSPYGIENTEKYESAKKVLNELDTDKSPEEIQKEIDNISDPGLRAFLELNKMAKGK